MEVIHHIPDYDSNNDEASQGEFGVIKSALRQFSEKYNNTAEDARKLKRSLKEKTMYHMLRSGYLSSDNNLFDDGNYWVAVTGASSKAFDIAAVTDFLKETGRLEVERDLFVFEDETGIIWAFPCSLSGAELFEQLSGHYKEFSLSHMNDRISLCLKARPVSEIHICFEEAVFIKGLMEMGDIELVGSFDCLPVYPETLSESAREILDRMRMDEEMSLKGFQMVTATLLSDDISMSEFYARVYVLALYLLKKSSDPIPFIQSFNEFFSKVEKENMNNYRELKNIRNILCAAYQSGVDCKQNEENSYMEYIHHLNEYVANNYDKPVTLNDVAEHLGITRQYFCNIIKKVYHITFVDYLNNFRINKAKELLTDPEIRINQIPIRVGFSSQSYFIKVFKQIVGLTPGEYRDYSREVEKSNSNS
jgi:AraC-like DNA-binding protein